MNHRLHFAYRAFLVVPVLLLAVSVVRPVAGQSGSEFTAVAPAGTINHLQIRVRDPQKSFEFYMKLFGGHLIDTSPNGWTMMLADTEQWLSFGRIPEGSDAKPGTLDHAGIGIDLPEDPEPLRQALKKAFAGGNVRSPGKPGDLTHDRSIYLNDPDGFSLQLISTKDDGHLPSADETPAASRTPATGFVRFRSLNHLSLTVSNREASRDFYARLLGTTVRDQNPGQINLTLPGAGAWISLLQANPRFAVPAGNLHHLGVGIDYPSDILGIDAFRERLRAAFPYGDVRSPGEPSPSMEANHNRSVYVTDPDGVSLQLVTSTDDGWLAASTKQ
jgi:catechol 2,3-dioxygenase-like lactoylglutathione lyase family enzyme